MKIKVGLVQEAPVFFDRAKTLAKIETLVAHHAAAGCRLLLFPESFVPGYPRGLDFGAVVGRRTEAGKALYARYYEESIDLHSEDRYRLESLAREYEIYLAVGVTERQALTGSLYCSLLYISPESGLMGVHRKIKPTGTERLIWAEAGGEALVSFATPLGRLGGLICWENYMPLARMAMYQQGVQIYLAPTADAREQWVATMVHIALEGRCFVLGCNQYIDFESYPEELRALFPDPDAGNCRGGSIIVGPNGSILAGPLWDTSGLLTAEIDLQQTIAQRLDFDPAGHYHRPDIFQFSVRDQPPILADQGRNSTS